MAKDKKKKGKKKKTQEENNTFAKQRVVRITHIKFESDVPVYNLQVSGHPSYYVNGILAHNCHLLPLEGEGMYLSFLKVMRKINPNVRVVGLTATPYRTKGGVICGEDYILNEICYEVGVKELIVKGFLCQHSIFQRDL